MVVGRVLAGVGIGISSSVVPLYISEISPKEIRGALGSANQVSINVGILLAIIAGLPLADNPAWWRTMFYLATIPAVLLFVGMVYSPESPRWLYKQGKTAEGEAAERQLWGRLKLEESFIATKATNSSVEEDATWQDLFGKRYRKGTKMNSCSN
jgi:MFS family permease